MTVLTGKRASWSGNLNTKVSWNSKKSLWGRFGGGWNWVLGIQVGGRSVIINLLVVRISITWEGKGTRF